MAKKGEKEGFLFGKGLQNGLEHGILHMCNHEGQTTFKTEKMQTAKVSTTEL